MSQVQDEPFSEFSRRLVEALTSPRQPFVPPDTLLARLWVLASGLDFRYVDCKRDSGPAQGGTLWKVVLSDGQVIVSVIGDHPTNQFWTYDDQARLPSSQRLADDADASITAERRRLTDIASMGTRGSTRDWVLGDDGPRRPSLAFKWQDGYEITLPLAEMPTPKQLEELHRLATII